MPLWSGEHRGFIVEAFLKNDESVTATQKAFRTRFGLLANESVPDRKTILLWVERVRATGSALKRKPPGRPKNVRTSENIDALRAAIELFPTRSARKHALALGISERTVRRILHTMGKGADGGNKPCDAKKPAIGGDAAKCDFENKREINAESEVEKNISP